MHRLSLKILLGLFCVLQPLHAADIPPSLSEKGVVLTTPDLGEITMQPPTITGADGKGIAPSFALDGDNRAKATFPNGFVVKVELSVANHSVTYSFDEAVEGVTAIRVMTLFPINLNEGGSYAIGPKKGAFPAELGSQTLGLADSPQVDVYYPPGDGLRFIMPAGVSLFQDNRTWNSKRFAWMYRFDLKRYAGSKSFTIKVGSTKDKSLTAASAADLLAKPKLRVLVDRYGQSARVDYPAKVKTDDELKADVASQLAALPKPAGPALDSFGGYAGSGEKYGLKKTGFFHLGTAAGRQVLVDPEGNVFHQLGFCGISNTDDYTLVQGRESAFEWLPETKGEFATAWRPKTSGVLSFYIANWIRKFGKPFTFEEWTGQIADRMKAWGFNSVGAFSIYSDTMRARNIPYVLPLPNGGSKMKTLPDRLGASFVMDPFAPGNQEALEKIVAGELASRENDPLLIGYYFGNEQHFELIPKLVPTYKASAVAAKLRLVEILQQKYGTIGAFNEAWNPAKPFASFDDLKEEPLFVRTDAGAADMQAFYELYLETYFSFIHHLLRTYAPNHLILGSRLTPGTCNNDAALRISGKYTDVVSVNYYTYGIEKAFLDRVNHLSGGRPVMLSEWYYSSGDQGLSTGREVKDQRARGLAYRNYVEQSAALPYVIGSQWFIYADQAITGRFFEKFNGEGNNTGFVNVVDRPYDELVAQARLTHDRLYDVIMGKTPPFLFDDARFSDKAEGKTAKSVSIPRALPGLVIDGTTRNWPGRPSEPLQNLASGLPNPAVRGDFRFSWDDQALYFSIQVKDPTPMLNQAEIAKMYRADGVELFVGVQDIAQGGTMRYSDRQVFLGAGNPARVYVVDHPADGAQCKSIAVKDVSGDGYVLQVSIPWTVLGFTPRAGTELLLDVGLTNSDDGLTRKQSFVWNGNSKNSSDRGAWGRARLIDN